MAKHSFCIVAFVLLLGRFGLAVAFWSPWTEWTSCNCTGQQERTRVCYHYHQNILTTIAHDCPGSGLETISCNKIETISSCGPVSAMTTKPSVTNSWSSWNEWTACTATCGGGDQFRSRHCQRSSASTANDCRGMSIESRRCVTKDCAVSVMTTKPPDADSWSAWNEWTSCTATCGGGDQFRKRHCHQSNGSTANDCPGMSVESRKCATQYCAANRAFWSLWTEWTSCNCTGQQERTRVCYHYHQNRPLRPATDCPGSGLETQLCNINETLISSCGPGKWNSWSDWTNCTELCSNNIRIRVRNCTNDEYTDLKNDCQGHSVETLPCPEINCTSQVTTTKPPDSWSNWSSWAICTATCGGGVKYRSRNCTTYDQIQTNNCNGPSVETETCNTNVCVDTVLLLSTLSSIVAMNPTTPATGTLAPASESTEQSTTMPASQHMSTSHPGSQQMTTKTPVFPVWSEWSSWSACTLTCNGGAKFRARDCLLPNSTISGNCEGQSFDYATCATNPCLLMTMKPPDLPVWSEWSSWTACSYTCNGGAKVRSRDCQLFNSAVPGTCEGQSVDIAVCSTDPCPYLWKPSSPPTVQLIGR